MTQTKEWTVECDDFRVPEAMTRAGAEARLARITEEGRCALDHRVVPAPGHPPAS